MNTNRRNSRTSRALLTPLAALLTLASFPGSLSAQTPQPPPGVDPAAHAAHAAAGTHPAGAAKGDAALAQQLAQLQAKVAQLEATLAKHGPAPSPGMAMGMMKPGGGMPGMSADPNASTPMAGMSGSGGGMNMMGKMDKMMGMMDKMMSMEGGMGMGMMKMGGPGSGGSMGGMSSGGGMMGMMDMDNMMGMSGGGMAGMTQSALPGFPGASHLYHIGATGFFLDHPQHITLSTEQQTALNKAKEQALLAKSTADRGVEQAEQELWTLTAADQPDAAKIEAKIREIEKLRGDQRLAFIRAVGEASRLLTDEQRKILTGFAPPAPMGGMKGM